MTDYTQRLIIVVKAAARQMAEDACIVADPEAAGTFFPGQPLRNAGDATNTVVAYWTSWVMTQAQKDNLVAEFGRKAGEFPIYTKNDNVPNNRNFWSFLASQQDPINGWTSVEVLAELGFDVLARSI